MNNLVALCAVARKKIWGNEIKRLGYKLAASDKFVPHLKERALATKFQVAAVQPQARGLAAYKKLFCFAGF